MKKQIIIIFMLVMFGSVFLISGTIKINPEKEAFSNCTFNCRLDKKINHQNCILNHYDKSKLFREEFKLCLEIIKEDYKNKSINNSQYTKSIKECTKNYVSNLKEIDKERKECVKNNSINCEKKCREQICLTLYQPVCGIDNKTYSNECMLKNADVKKACDGECPCIVCKNYYWYDDNNTKCEKKKFCGAFMYEGLNVFESKEDCKASLKNLTDEGKHYCKNNPTENCTTTKVCGWSNPQKIQCFKYPCATGFNNSCDACKDENVLYWTYGECPK